MNSSREIGRAADKVVGPRMSIPEDAELRVRLDVDPEGNRAVRIDQYVVNGDGLEHQHGPLWINPHGLNGLSADFGF